MTKARSTPADGPPARRGLPRWVGLAAITLTAIVTLYFAMYFALFYWLGERTEVPNAADFFIYDRSNGAVPAAKRITTVRQPPWARAQRWYAAIEAIYFPLTFADVWREAVPASQVQRDRLKKCLDDFQVREGQGVIIFNGGKIQLVRRTGWWSGSHAETRPDPDSIKSLTRGVTR